MLECVTGAANGPAEQHQRADPEDGAPYRPLALHALEMLDAVPSPVAPRPGAALGAKHEKHDEADARNERQERDVGVVADAPYPIEQECAPVPAVDFRRNGFRIGTNGRVAHDAG